MNKIQTIVLMIFCCLSLFQCYSPKWNSLRPIDTQSDVSKEVLEIFNNYPSNVMTLEALSPAYDYKYDIGGKDTLYGIDSLTMRFEKVEIELADQKVEGKIMANFSFVDGNNNRINIGNVDLLRLVPILEGPNELVYAELLLKEYNRFGYLFRREHDEFEVLINKEEPDASKRADERIYRCKITNNCLAPGKWEFELTSENYSKFKEQVKGENNRNQNKVMAHSWFHLNDELYEVLIKLKNPGKSFDMYLPYDSISSLAEMEVVNYDKLRNPLKSRIETTLLEVGHQTSRDVKPVDVEQGYKKDYGLFLNDTIHTYTTILESSVKLTQFRDEGFYKETSPYKFDFSWMKHMDSVSVETIDVQGTDAYVQITLTGKWSPYTVTIGNIDMAQIDEQKLLGSLFGINTYPKTRRYNPLQSTIAFDADQLPDDRKPYLLLTDSKTGKWVNNQYKGIEKVYLTYETIDREILTIYVLSYERIIPVWMARVQLPSDYQEKVRVRKSWYNY